MIKNTSYLKLIKKTYKRNYKLYRLENEALSIYIFTIISFLVTPLFLIFNISANYVTLINLIIGSFSIFFLISTEYNSFALGIIIYFIFRILDCVDGNVARITEKTSFFGRFCDSTLDIFYESFFILALGFYSLNYLNSENLFFIGILASLLSMSNTFIYDKYASLIRWSNDENNLSNTPYLRKKSFARFFYTLTDLKILLLVLFLLFYENDYLMHIFLSIFFLKFILMSLFNLIKHFIHAKKNLEFYAGDKKTYVRKK